MTATQQLCTFFLNPYFFGIEVHKVQEVLRPQDITRVPLSDDVVGGLINLRGQIVTAIDLRGCLGLEASRNEGSMNVVVRTEEGAVSFLVDEIGDVVEVEDGGFEPPPDTLEGPVRELVRGVYKLKDRLLIVLDTTRALRQQNDEAALRMATE